MCLSLPASRAALSARKARSVEGTSSSRTSLLAPKEAAREGSELNRHGHGHGSGGEHNGRVVGAAVGERGQRSGGRFNGY
jgi:hypothetical protein